MQSDAGWKPAVITGIADAPRSYTLTTREGQTYRRNRKYIRKSHTAHDDSAHDDSDDDDNFPSTTQKQHCKVIGTTVARELFLHQQPRAGPLETLLSAMLTPTHCDSNSLKEGGCDNYGTLTLFMP